LLLGELGFFVIEPVLDLALVLYDASRVLRLGCSLELVLADARNMSQAYLLGFPGIAMLCLGSLSLSNSAILRAIAVCCLAESSFSPRWLPGCAAARFLFFGLIATLDGS
jgi:hypothetical protein